MLTTAATIWISSAISKISWIWTQTSPRMVVGHKPIPRSIRRFPPSRRPRRNRSLANSRHRRRLHSSRKRHRPSSLRLTRNSSLSLRRNSSKLRKFRRWLLSSGMHSSISGATRRLTFSLRRFTLSPRKMLSSFKQSQRRFFRVWPLACISKQCRRQCWRRWSSFSVGCRRRSNSISSRPRKLRISKPNSTPPFQD